MRFGRSNRNSLLSGTKSPGPGQYSTSLEFLHKSPSYGMRIKLKENKRVKEAPGPGNYDPRDEYILRRITSKSLSLDIRFETEVIQ